MFVIYFVKMVEYVLMLNVSVVRGYMEEIIVRYVSYKVIIVFIVGCF